MGNIFNPPSVGQFSGVFEEADRGIAFIQAADENINITELVFLIQSFTIQKNERIQEVRTLADTEHLYTFGKELPRFIVNGYIINEILASETAQQYAFHRGGTGSKSSQILDLWDSSIRAKSIGTNFEGSFPVQIDLTPLNRVLFGVGVNMNIGNDINLESLLTASFTFIITEEEPI
jgi:hypothetical protein